MNPFGQLHSPDIDASNTEKELVSIHTMNSRGRGIGPSFTFIFDHRYDTFSHIDQEIYQVLGYQAELVQRSGLGFFETIIHPDEYLSIKQLAQRAWEVICNRPSALQKKYVISIDFWIKHQCGSYIHIVQESTILTTDERRSIIHSQSTCYDITHWQKTSPRVLSIYYRNHLLKRWSAAQSDRIELLSFREKEVIREVCQGLTSAEIAKKLNLSIHTVSTHRKTILRKLNLKGTSALIHFALQNHII